MADALAQAQASASPFTVADTGFSVPSPISDGIVSGFSWSGLMLRAMFFAIDCIVRPAVGSSVRSLFLQVRYCGFAPHGGPNAHAVHFQKVDGSGLLLGNQTVTELRSGVCCGTSVLELHPISDSAIDHLSSNAVKISHKRIAHGERGGNVARDHQRARIITVCGASYATVNVQS